MPNKRRWFDAPISVASSENVLVPKRHYEILSSVYRGVHSVEKLAEKLDTSPSALMRDLAELEARGLIKTRRKKTYEVELTDEGKKYSELGLPEKRLLLLLLKLKEKDKPSLSLKEAPQIASEEGIELNAREAVIALQHLARRKLCSVSKGVVELIAGEKEISEFIRHLEEKEKKLKEVLAEKERLDVSDLSEFKSRRLLKIKERAIIKVYLTDQAKLLLEKNLIKPAEIVTRLTPELIISGKWKEVIIKKFDLSVDVPTLHPSRKHPYMELLDEIRDILMSMGFEEMKGPHVELELWNFDALFQAQDHPAREVHDTFYLKYPTQGYIEDKELLKRIKAVHENGWITGSRGWRYKWRAEKALSLILRTQTTAVSTRTLYERGDGEYRCFALDRVFRPETLDPTHSMEFYQLEGIIVGRSVTFRHLLGFFVEFAKKLGLGKVKIKPAYFPFTEPSVEGFIKHPKLGWIEVFPGGMFRPEVLLPLGVKECNVAAWGIGIDRIAMTLLDIDDIRDLFSQDLMFLRSKPVPLIKSILR
ncbi:MAG: phenylalanine--tRNA ligase subunit alpha [Thermoprotei archaeon]|nr:MAG: phenylalanine--tRNA ligase subunit alpha [Thermoprotei archaeon]